MKGSCPPPEIEIPKKREEKKGTVTERGQKKNLSTKKQGDPLGSGLVLFALA